MVIIFAYSSFVSIILLRYKTKTQIIGKNCHQVAKTQTKVSNNDFDQADLYVSLVLLIGFTIQTVSCFSLCFEVFKKIDKNTKQWLNMSFKDNNSYKKSPACFEVYMYGQLEALNILNMLSFSDFLYLKLFYK